MRKRVFYNKIHEMKYISHLDLIKFIERLLKIGGIKPSFTQGFHPRPKMTFGNALPLGMESFSDVFEFETEEDISDKDVFERLSKKVPIGFEIVSVETIDKKSSVVTDFNAVKYEISFDNQDFFNEFLDLMKKESIIVKKEKNGKVTERDLKPKIRKYEAKDNIVLIFLDEISPKYLFEYIGKEPENVNIKRVGYSLVS